MSEPSARRPQQQVSVDLAVSGNDHGHPEQETASFSSKSSAFSGAPRAGSGDAEPDSDPAETDPGTPVPGPVTPESHTASPGPVQHCPFCGELIGSFWARKDVDGRAFCESCDVYFEVTVAQE